MTDPPYFQLPPELAEHSSEAVVTIDGVSYRLTHHGRRRFLERVGAPYDDCGILLACVGDPRAVWKPDAEGFGLRLVTYLSSQK